MGQLSNIGGLFALECTRAGRIYNGEKLPKCDLVGLGAGLYHRGNLEEIMRKILMPMLFASLVSGCFGSIGEEARKAASAISGSKKATGDQVAVLGGRVKVTGPQGYCVDNSGVRSGTKVAFVPLGRCAAVTGKGSASGAPHFLTASVVALPEGVLPDGPKKSEAIKAYVASEKGRAALAHSGQASDVEILSSQARDGGVISMVRDASAPSQLSKTSARAFYAGGDTAVSLSVTAFAGQEGQGAVNDLLLDFLAAMQKINGDGKTSEKSGSSLFNSLLN